MRKDKSPKDKLVSICKVYDGIDDPIVKLRTLKAMILNGKILAVDIGAGKYKKYAVTTQECARIRKDILGV